MNQQFLTQLDQLCAQHGMTRTIVRGEITIKDPGSEKVMFGHNARYLGLEAGDYGAIVTIQGRRFKVTGVKSTRPKYPLDGECLSTGKVYKLPRSVIPDIVAARSTTPAPTPTASAPTQLSTSSQSSNSQTDDRYADVAQF